MAIKINIDFETYSEADLKKVGPWVYSCHPSTEVICLAVSVDGHAPVLINDFEKEAPALFGPLLQKAEIHAWNSFFEYCIWHNTLKWPAIPVEQWHDTAALAAALALPRALGACGAALGLPQDKAKDKRGSYLIHRLCKPNRGKRILDPDLYAELYAYCVQDVVAEQAIAEKLRPLSTKERAIWELDQKINIRGVYVDRPRVNDAIEMIHFETSRLNGEVETITNGELTDVAKRAKVINYAAENGYELEKYTKDYLAEVLDDPELPKTLRRLIEIRLQTGKTSLAKYPVLLQLSQYGDRAHGLLRYHGASTGRWSGALFQPQNLPRPAFSDTDACVSLFQYKDPEMLSDLFREPLDCISSCLRGMVCSPPGKRLLVADYAAIEARVLAWLAGQKDVLEVFRTHGKIYEHTASQIYNKPVDQINKDQRFMGKVACLALGFQGGKRAFQRMAEAYGVDIPARHAEKIKDDWRQANDKIVKFWWSCQEAAINAVQHPGSTHTVRNISYRVIKGYLFCKLPSGRCLAYYRPGLRLNDWGKPELVFWGTNSVTRKWEQQSSYGGKLVENITQAVARDLMAEAMLKIDQAGYDIVLSVHDELIAETDQDFGSLEEFEALMCDLPTWAEGLPIETEGFESARYRK